MDTRALSMARNLRHSACVGTFVLYSVCSAAMAQQHGNSQVTVPFSALSAGAQAEILALTKRGVSADPQLFPLDEPVSRGIADQGPVQALAQDGRKARINWAIGVYR